MIDPKTLNAIGQGGLNAVKGLIKKAVAQAKAVERLTHEGNDPRRPQSLDAFLSNVAPTVFAPVEQMARSMTDRHLPSDERRRKTAQESKQGAKKIDKFLNSSVASQQETLGGYTLNAIEQALLVRLLGAGATTEGAEESLSLGSTLGSDRNIAIIRNRVVPEPGLYDVIVHGTEENFQVFQNGKWEVIDQRRLASYMEKTGYEGGPVRLLSCSTGACGGAVAQDLANKLGHEVVAPTDKAWVHPDGTITIGPNPNVNSGSWRTFWPGEE